MRPSKLYIRIFVSFLVLLIVTEIAIFGFFVTLASRKFRDYYQEYSQIRFNMAREITEYQLRKSPDEFTNHTAAFQEFIDHLGVAFKTNIWITDEDHEVLYDSFKKRFPWHKIERRLEELQDEDSFFRHFSRFDIYKKGIINVHNGQTLTLHLLFDDRPPFRHLEGFAIGLVMIGLIVGLLTFPIARKISKPIKALTESAKRLEQGDLSHRTTASSKDEIGELAKAFNRMAEKLERMVKSGKEMMAQVSHELRSPLARIQIAVEILKDKLEQQSDGETTNHLKEIQVDVEELDKIIGRILELSKLDLQTDVPYTEVFSPVKLLTETLGKYDSVLKNKKIRILTEFAVDAKIIGNKEAFLTVLNNLLDNICKYAPTQGTVHLKSGFEDTDLQLMIANSGGHLAESDLQKIFDPFVRFDTNGENGAGLGLSIAKRIVEKHGGTIVALNTEVGLEFRIRMPVVRLE